MASRPRACERRGRLLGRSPGRAAAAVDEDEAREALGAGLAREVPRGVRGRDRPAERVTAQHDVAAAPSAARTTRRRSSTSTCIPHSRANGDLGVGNRREVVRDARVGELAEVVVEECLGVASPSFARSSIEWSSRRFSRRSTAHTCQPGASEATTARGVRNRPRSPRFRGYHEHVLAAPADLEDPDPVEPGRGPRRLVAAHALERDADVPCSRARRDEARRRGRGDRSRADPSHGASRVPEHARLLRVVVSRGIIPRRGRAVAKLR